jgi:hypothetical protein
MTWTDAYVGQRAQVMSLYGNWGPNQLDGSKLVPVTPVNVAVMIRAEWINKAGGLYSSQAVVQFANTTDALITAASVVKQSGGGVVAALDFSQTVAFWNALYKLAADIGSTVGLPSTWTMVFDSVSESVDDAVKAAKKGLENLSTAALWLLQYGPYVALGLLGFVAYSYLPKRKA